MPSSSSSSFLRQLSKKETWKSKSKRHNNSFNNNNNNSSSNWSEVEGLNSNNYNGRVTKKRVMVVVDQTSNSKHAMMWALTHVANKGDLVTLLHIIPSLDHPQYDSTLLASSLGSLCKACKPEVEVEALVIQGPKLATIMSQVKKLEVSVLVLAQNKSSSFLNCICGVSSTEEFVQECISNAECLTIGVRKQSKGMGGYLITTRWQKNFWLLA